MRWHFLTRVYHDPFVLEALRPYIQANNLLLTLNGRLCLSYFTFCNFCHLSICVIYKWNTARGQLEVGKFWKFSLLEMRKEKLPIKTYAGDYLYVTRF